MFLSSPAVRQGSWRVAVVLLFCQGFCGIAFAPNDLHAQDRSLAAEIEHGVQGVFAKCKNAVVRVEAVDGDRILSGTGFFISPDGLLYTSYSVGGEASDLNVLVGPAKISAKRIACDSRAGIALLKVDAKTSFLPLGNSRALGIGSPLVMVGYPMDLPLTPCFGTVAGFDEHYHNRFFATAHIRANMPVQGGEGGAPVLNFKAEVVGIAISSLDQGSAMFALPIEAAEKVRHDFGRFGAMHPGWLGMDVGPAANEQGGSSAEIRNIFPSSPAQACGLEIGDVLLDVGDLHIAKPEDVVSAAYFITADEPIRLRVSRAGKPMEVLATPRRLNGSAMPTLEAPSSDPLDFFNFGPRP